MIKIYYLPPFPLPADFKFKQVLAKYHQMIIDIYVMEPIHYLRILSMVTIIKQRNITEINTIPKV